MSEPPPRPSTSIEEAIEAHLRRMGLTRCRQAVPCFVGLDRRESVPLCACAVRYRRWLTFWTLVRGDLEGLPRELPQRLGAYVDYSGPIFVHVCPGCGAHAEAWSRSMWGRAVLMEPEISTWILATTPVHPERARHLLGEYLEFFACSSECAERYRVRLTSPP